MRLAFELESLCSIKTYVSKICLFIFKDFEIGICELLVMFCRAKKLLL